MANAQWPATLPPVLFQEGFEASEGDDAILRTQMEVGPAKMRQRTSDATRPTRGTIRVDNTQLATFQTFYRTTIKRVLPFDWVEALPGGSQTAATYRFVRPPTYRSLSSGHDYEISLDLEILP